MGEEAKGQARGNGSPFRLLPGLREADPQGTEVGMGEEGGAG